jgi:enoyl-CoA hydratase
LDSQVTRSQVCVPAEQHHSWHMLRYQRTLQENPFSRERKNLMSATQVSTSFENITYEVKGSIGYITLNRPKVMNALNRRTVEELNAAFAAAKEDATVKGIILTGAGEKAFIAGADIAELSAIDGDKAGEFSAKGQQVLLFIETLGKPVIAAVNGFALGGGCETAMACTIRIAVENAKFGQPEVKLGIIPGYGGTQRLPRLVGKGRALQLILTGDLIDAHEAYRIGLVNEVVPAADLISRCEAILKQIDANAPLAIQYAIDAVNEGVNTDLGSGLKLEAKYFTLAAGTDDRKEGTSAFVQKRAPKFQGK